VPFKKAYLKAFEFIYFVCPSKICSLYDMTVTKKKKNHHIKAIVLFCKNTKPFLKKTEVSPVLCFYII